MSYLQSGRLVHMTLGVLFASLLFLGGNSDAAQATGCYGNMEEVDLRLRKVVHGIESPWEFQFDSIQIIGDIKLTHNDQEDNFNICTNEGWEITIEEKAYDTSYVNSFICRKTTSGDRPIFESAIFDGQRRMTIKMSDNVKNGDSIHCTATSKPVAVEHNRRSLF